MKNPSIAFSGKAYVLHQKLIDIIISEEFNDVTLAETIGALFLIMLALSERR